MGITPSQPVAVAAQESPNPSPSALPQQLLDELWTISEASAYQLPRPIFESILIDLGEAQDYGHPPGIVVAADQQAAWFRGLRLAEIVLARACAQGNEEAWRYFLAQYRQPILRAATMITHSESLGADLAENLYAELYGLNLRDGQRRSPLASYQGRGSLIGWLRTILAQRHIDHHRRTHREQSLESEAHTGETTTFDPPAPIPAPDTDSSTLIHLRTAIQAALEQCNPEDRFLLSSYYLDQRTLLEISKILRVHEATISRRLRRTTDRLRKDLLRHLQSHGLSKRAAQEALGADPRDIELNLRQLMQLSPDTPFSQEEGK